MAGRKYEITNVVHLWFMFLLDSTKPDSVCSLLYSEEFGAGRSMATMCKIASLGKYVLNADT